MYSFFDHFKDKGDGWGLPHVPVATLATNMEGNITK